MSNFKKGFFLFLFLFFCIGEAQQIKSVNQIRDAYLSGNYNETLKDIKTRESNKSAPKSNILLYYKALVQYSLAFKTKSKISQRKYWRLAARDLEKVIADSSDYVEARVKAGEVYKLLNMPAMAEKHFIELLNLRKKSNIENTDSTKEKGVNISIVNQDTLVVNEEISFMSSLKDAFSALFQETIIIVVFVILLVMVVSAFILLFFLRKKFLKNTSGQVAEVSEKEISEIAEKEENNQFDSLSKTTNSSADLENESFPEENIEEENDSDNEDYTNPEAALSEMLDDNLRARIFELYEDGYSNAEIAEQLSVSVDEVTFVLSSAGEVDNAQKRGEEEYLNEKAGGVLEESDEASVVRKVKELALNGKTKEEIAEEVGKTFSEVEEILDLNLSEANNTDNQASEQEFVVEEDDQLKAIIELAEQGKSKIEIAEELGIGLDEVEFAASLNNLTISEESSFKNSNEEPSDNNEHDNKEMADSDIPEDTGLNAEIPDEPEIAEEEMEHKDQEEAGADNSLQEISEDNEIPESSLIEESDNEVNDNPEDVLTEDTAVENQERKDILEIDDLIEAVKSLKAKSLTAEQIADKLNLKLKEVNYIYKLFPAARPTEPLENSVSRKDMNESIIKNEQHPDPVVEDQLQNIKSDSFSLSEDENEDDDSLEISDLKKDQVISYIVAGYTRQQIVSKTGLTLDEVEFVGAVNDLKFAEDLEIFKYKIDKEKAPEENLDEIIERFESNKAIDKNLQAISYDEELDQEKRTLKNEKSDEGLKTGLDIFKDSNIGTASQLFAYENAAFDFSDKGDEDVDNVMDMKKDDLFQDDEVIPDEKSATEVHEELTSGINDFEETSTLLSTANNFDDYEEEATLKSDNKKMISKIENFLNDNEDNFEEENNSDFDLNADIDNGELELMKKVYGLLDEGMNDTEIAEILNIDIEDVKIYVKIKKEDF